MEHREDLTNMCSVVEIVNSEEYNIYYQSPQTLQHKDLPPIIESETEQDFSLEEFGSYHFIKESSAESSPSKELKITNIEFVHNNKT